MIKDSLPVEKSPQDKKIAETTTQSQLPKYKMARTGHPRTVAKRLGTA